jgi:ribosomal protein S27AE
MMLSRSSRGVQTKRTARQLRDVSVGILFSRAVQFWTPCSKRERFAGPGAHLPTSHGRSVHPRWGRSFKTRTFPQAQQPLALCGPDFRLTDVGTGGKILAMGQAKRPTCPNCGADLFLALPPDGKGQRKPQCFDCDGPDPLKTEQATGWLKSELQPPK